MSEREIIKLEPSSEKSRILYQKARYKVLYGGRASGKSWEAFIALIYYALKYDILIVCCREVQKTIRDSSHKLIRDTIKRLELEEHFEVTNAEIRCIPTGATFVFKGIGRDPEAIKSLENAQICVFEEAQCLSKESIDDAVPTIRGNGAECWFLFNPRLPTDAVSRMFLSGSVPPNTLIEKVNYYDNKYLPEVLKDDITHCKMHSPEDYKHIWEGEYKMQGDDLYVPLRDVINSQRRYVIKEEHAPIRAGLDVARYGDDASVLYIRRGNEIIHHQKWTNMNLVQLQHEVVQACLIHKVDDLIIDGAGLGAGVVDHMKHAININVIEFNGAYRASKGFLNARAEMWGKMKTWIQGNGCLPINLELEGQLSTIKYIITNKGEVQLEKKSEMKKRGIQSPDEADALSMTFYKEESQKIDNTIEYMAVGPDEWQG